MKILITLEEVLDRCNNWIDFCKDFGYSEYSVNEGGGNIEVEMTEEQAKKHGII